MSIDDAPLPDAGEERPPRRAEARPRPRRVRQMDKIRLGIGKRLLHSGLAITLVRRTFAGQFSSAKAHEQATAQFALDYAEAAYVKKQNQVVWVNAFFPVEIVWGLGLVPFHPEVAAAVATAIGITEQSLAAAEAEGYPLDLCTFHRNIAGLHSVGMFPKMDACVSTSNLCDIASKTLANLALLEKRPFQLVDVPQVYDRESVLYVERQLRQVVDELCAQTGVALDEDRLREAIRESNLARDYAKEICELRVAHPAPIKGSGMLGQLAFLAMAFGNPKGTAYYRALRDYVAGLVARGEGEQAVQNCRLYWMHLGPYYTAELMPHLEDELGVAIAFEEDSNVWWPPLDESRPFFSLAEKIVSHFCNGPVENRMEQILQDVEKYKAAGVVHWNQWGCRQSTGALRVVGDRLRAEGIPFLQLDGDCIDPRNFQWGPLRTRVEGFLEMIV